MLKRKIGLVTTEPIAIDWLVVAMESRGFELDNYFDADTAVTALGREKHSLVILHPRTAPGLNAQHPCIQCVRIGYPTPGIVGYEEVTLALIKIIREKDSINFKTPITLLDFAADLYNNEDRIGDYLKAGATKYIGPHHKAPRVIEELEKLVTNKR